MVDLPPEFRTTPFTYYIWSRSPRASQILAYAVAQFADPGFRWMCIREESSLPSDEERWVGRLLPPARVLSPMAETDMGRSRRPAKESFQELIRAEGSSADRFALDTFLLLPLHIQGILDEVHTGSNPRAVVITNTNRVRQFFPTDPDSLRVYTDVFPRIGFSMITTSIPPPFRGRYGFNVVLRVDVTSAHEWQDAHLVVEKGFRAGDFRTGATFPVNQLPWYLETGRTIEKNSA